MVCRQDETCLEECCSPYVEEKGARIYCEENNCEQSECHRCFPVPGCGGHEKCRSITHPAVGTVVSWDRGNRAGTVVEVLGFKGGHFPSVLVVEHHSFGKQITIETDWINWEGDPW